jgi:hypothetical protein
MDYVGSLGTGYGDDSRCCDLKDALRETDPFWPCALAGQEQKTNKRKPASNGAITERKKANETK